MVLFTARLIGESITLSTKLLMILVVVLNDKKYIIFKIITWWYNRANFIHWHMIKNNFFLHQLLEKQFEHLSLERWTLVFIPSINLSSTNDFKHSLIWSVLLIFRISGIIWQKEHSFLWYLYEDSQIPQKQICERIHSRLSLSIFLTIPLFLYLC